MPGSDLEAGLAAPALPSATGRGRPGGWVQASIRWIVERRLVLATGLVAAIPIIASTVRAVNARWVPLGDDGTIAVRAFDVLSAHPPLLGQYSNSSGVTGQELHSLGPMLYWLLTLPVHFLGYVSPAVVIGLVNVACVMGIVALARRRGGEALMIATSVAMLVMCGSFAAEVFHDVWNPAAALLPLTLLIFVAWSLACGEHRLLPLAILVASFVAQCHMTYVLPAIGLLGVAVVGLVVSRRTAATPPEALRGWVLAALVAAAVCWSAPLLDQVTHRPGNFVILARTAAAQKSTLGAAAGGRAVARAVGVPPWWLRPAPEPIPRLAEVAGGRHSSPPGLFSVASTVVIIGLVLGLAVVAVRRRRTDVVAALAMSLILCATLAIAVASTPTKDFILVVSVGYSSWWGAPAGMFVWLALGWSAAALFGRARHAALRLTAAARLGAVGAVAIVAALVTANAGPDPLASAFGPVRTIIARIEAQLPRHHPILVDSAPTIVGADLQPPVVLALRRRGTPVTTAALLPALGQYYNPTHHPDADVLRIDEGDRPGPPGGRVIARVSLHPAAGGPFGQLAPTGGHVTVTLTPHRRVPGQ